MLALLNHETMKGRYSEGLSNREKVEIDFLNHGKQLVRLGVCVPSLQCEFLSIIGFSSILRVDRSRESPRDLMPRAVLDIILSKAV